MITENTYNHMYQTVYTQRGHYSEATPLPSWLQITIQNNGDCKSVVVKSKIHINKETPLPCTYSIDYPDMGILKDQSATIYSRFIR